MKVIITLLFFFIGINISYSQQTAVVKNANNLTSIKSIGSGEITLPSRVTIDEVKRNAKFYIKYFTVDFNENTHVATFNMVQNDAQARNIIVRFLAACDVSDVNVDGVVVNRDELFEKYLK